MKKFILAIIFACFCTGVFAVYISPPPSTSTSTSTSGTGDVIGPATNTTEYIPQWNGANSKTLKNGLPASALGKSLLNASSAAAANTALGLKKLATMNAITNAEITTGNFTGITGVGTLTTFLTVSNNSRIMGGLRVGAATGVAPASGNVKVKGTVQVSGNIDSLTGFSYYKAPGDTQPEVSLKGTVSTTFGGLAFGPGGSTAPDVDLFRSGANVLKTNDSMLIISGLGVGISNTVAGSIRCSKSLGVSENLSVTGTQRFVGQTSFDLSSYGEYVVTYNLSLTTVALTAAYVTMNAPMIAGTDIALKNVTQSGGVFTVGVAGQYEIRFFGNLDKETDTDDIEGGISINGADPVVSCEFRMDGILSGYNPVQSVKTRTLSVGDKVCIKLKNVTASRYVIPRSCTFSVRKHY